MKSDRELFEEFLCAEYPAWAAEAINSAHFVGDDKTGYYRGCTHIYDNKSCDDALFWAWRGWQGSRTKGRG